MLFRLDLQDEVNHAGSATIEEVLVGDLLRGLELGPEGAGDLPRNCKVGQPLSVAQGEREGGTSQPRRLCRSRTSTVRFLRRLPKTKDPRTVNPAFDMAQAPMAHDRPPTYPDDGVARSFLKPSPQAGVVPRLAGVMDRSRWRSSVVPCSTQSALVFLRREVHQTCGLSRPAMDRRTRNPAIGRTSMDGDYIFRRSALLNHLPTSGRAPSSSASCPPRGALRLLRGP